MRTMHTMPSISFISGQVNFCLYLEKKKHSSLQALKPSSTRKNVQTPQGKGKDSPLTELMVECW